MKVRELIDILLDGCEMNDEIVVAKGTVDDFDFYSTEYVDVTDHTTEKNCLYLFTGECNEV